MLAFLKANYLTIIITFLLLLFVVMVVRKLIKDKKNGVSSCGCDCSKCSACCGCAPKE